MRFQVYLLIALLGHTAQTQIRHPKASPFSVVEQAVGLSTIRIEYSRPAVRGRHIFGPQQDGQQGLVPFDRIWRMGANESTKLEVDSEMTVLGNNLPKGKYALYAFPQKNSWEIAFHKNLGHWGDGRKNYDSNEDLFRIRLTPMQLAYHQENFLMVFDSITHESANLEMVWASTKISIPFKVDTYAQMEKEMTAQLAENPTAQTYYEAARFLQEQDKDLKRALKYLNKALEIKGDTYYFHRLKSLIEAQMGNYQKAVRSAQKSLALAKALEKDEFVRMNQKNIKKWNAIHNKR